MTTLYHHQPVLLDYIVKNLLPNRDLIVDATLGEGGHTLAFLEKNKHVICFERDKQILAKAKNRLKNYNNVQYINQNFSNINCLTEKYSKKIDLILFDLGISMFHYRESQRGFSFYNEEKLDMRLDENKVSAYEVINFFPEEDLANLFYRYGEEKKSRLYASRICNFRQQQKITTNRELCDIITGGKKWNKKKIHPATKIFQAIRIHVNDELSHIEKALQNTLPLLSANGALAVISYHSLEDRIVKNFFKTVLPIKKQINKYRLKKEDSNELYNNCYSAETKIILADKKELQQNKSSRSAKMRILYKNAQQ